MLKRELKTNGRCDKVKNSRVHLAGIAPIESRTIAASRLRLKPWFLQERLYVETARILVGEIRPRLKSSTGFLAGWD
jgi:hypothetical protein